MSGTSKKSSQTRSLPGRLWQRRERSLAGGIVIFADLVVVGGAGVAFGSERLPEVSSDTTRPGVDLRARS